MEIIEASKKLITAQGTDLTLLYDDSLYRHCMNVARLSTQLGQLKGFDEHDLILLGAGSLLHDIGKIKLDNRILDKPGKLTDEEFFNPAGASCYRLSLPVVLSLSKDSYGYCPLSP